MLLKRASLTQITTFGTVDRGRCYLVIFKEERYVQIVEIFRLRTKKGTKITDYSEPNFLNKQIQN